MAPPVVDPALSLREQQALAAPVGSTLRGIGLMVLAILLFTIMDTTGKVMIGYYPVQQVAWARYFFHFALMLVLLPRVGVFELVRTARPAVQVFRGLLVALATICMMTALSRVPLAEVYTITFAAPLIITVFSIPLLGEKVGWRRWTAVLVGFAGVLIVIRPGYADTDWVMILPLITATCFALYQVLTRKLGALPTERPLALLFYMAMVGTIAMTILVPPFWQPVAWQHWLVFIVMGALGAVGHMMLIRALAMAPASLLSPLIYTQLVWAITFGYFLFGDVPDGWTLIGSAVIIASGLFVVHRETVTRRRR